MDGILLAAAFCAEIDLCLLQGRCACYLGIERQGTDCAKLSRICEEEPGDSGA
jgi:hypothetical protein